MSHRNLWVAGFLVLSAACSGASKDGTETVAPMGGGGTGVGPVAGIGMVPGGTTGGTPATGAGGAGMVANGAGGAAAMPPPSAECVQGAPLTVVGMMYSPGGTVLPNPCLPFHPTTNNPYAVRCIDAWSFYKTKFPGDQYCILPPTPGMGVQFGVHPQGAKWYEIVSKGDMSGYDNPTDEFVMQAGEEEEKNYHTSATNPTASNYYRNHVRMRAGSHHMINNSAAAGGMQEYWSPGSPDGLSGAGFVPGAERPDENNPKTQDKPVEDKGLYASFPAAPGITFNMHHFNASDGPILKETWINLWWETADATVKIIPINDLLVEFTQTASLSIAPGTTQDLHYVGTVTAPTRVISLFGHRHAWTTNFTAWIEAAGKPEEIIYQSFGWLDEPTYRYDSLEKNPAPAPDKLTDGASSGLRMLSPGEKLHYNCHIEYTQERATKENYQFPTKGGTIRFSNQAFEGEMCLLFGSVSGASLPPFAGATGPVPAFATVD